MSRTSSVPAGRTVAPLFAALGDETRLRLLQRLSAGAPESIARLSARSALSRQAITKHLAVLSRAGLIHGHRQGREHLWQLQPARLADARQYLNQVSQRWDSALDRLRLYVER